MTNSGTIVGVIVMVAIAIANCLKLGLATCIAAGRLARAFETGPARVNATKTQLMGGGDLRTNQFDKQAGKKKRRADEGEGIMASTRVSFLAHLLDHFNHSRKRL